jgi:arsenate reductase (thioredoxin)
MAEAMARAMAPRGVKIYSAGSKPTSVHPLCVQAMKEVGLDVSRHQAKHLEVLPSDINVFIRLCDEEDCPVGEPGSEKHHWPIADPAPSTIASDDAEALKQFRKAREELRIHLQTYFRRMEDSPVPD